MLVFKYTKSYPSNMAGHMDTMRTIMRLIRRAGVKVNYSQGFNPHMQVAGGVALAVGIESCCEYVSVDMQWQDGLIELFNNVSPKGIVFTDVIELPKANLIADVTSADYVVSMQNIANYANQLLAKPLSIEFVTNKGLTVKQVDELIYSLEVVDNDTIAMNIACGNNNLRADRLIEHLIKSNNLSCNYAIVKKCTYAKDVDFDSYLKQLVVTD